MEIISVVIQIALEAFMFVTGMRLLLREPHEYEGGYIRVALFFTGALLVVMSVIGMFTTLHHQLSQTAYVSGTESACVSDTGIHMQSYLEDAEQAN